MNTQSKHRWKFFRSGGVDQVMLRDGKDLAHLKELDLKLWMALAMPTTGIEFDAETAAFLDADKDGRIRPPEVFAALDWCESVFHDLGDLLEPSTSIPLSSIKDQEILSGAKRVLQGLGKADEDAISIDDIRDQVRVFVNTRFNGDGVIIPESTDDPDIKEAITFITQATGGVVDLSGKLGINEELILRFVAEARDLLAWSQQPSSSKTILPLEKPEMEAASGIVTLLKPKIDDFFARCRLASFEPKARDVINRDTEDYAVFATQTLSAALTEIADFPLAFAEAGKELSLTNGINPAWASDLDLLQQKALIPLLKHSRSSLSEQEWHSLQSTLDPFRAWISSKPASPGVQALTQDQLAKLSAQPLVDTLSALIVKDKSLEAEYSQITSLNKMLHFRKDMMELLTNFVNFSDFYGKSDAVFQAGTLFLDARSCNLCIEVADVGRHAALAGLSAAYLAYCEISRPNHAKRSIVAVFTGGDSDRLIVGRNGVFYDRKGLDWDATITKIVSSPISIREAFLLPYKKFVRMIEEQIAKRAQEADAASTGKLGDIAGKVATADQIKASPQAAAPVKKLDLGTIALIGTAIGGVSALVGGFLSALFGLGFWLPLGVLGMLMLISGPSMLLAWMKLRQRNLAPILDANGWAINTRARMNVPFGAALTQLAHLPPGSERTLEDPFAEKKRPWRLYFLLVILAAIAWFWYDGKLNTFLPSKLTRTELVMPSDADSEPASETEIPSAE